MFCVCRAQSWRVGFRANRSHRVRATDIVTLGTWRPARCERPDTGRRAAEESRAQRERVSRDPSALACRQPLAGACNALLRRFAEQRTIEALAPGVSLQIMRSIRDTIATASVSRSSCSRRAQFQRGSRDRFTGACCATLWTATKRLAVPSRNGLQLARVSTHEDFRLLALLPLRRPWLLGIVLLNTAKSPRPHQGT